MKLLLAACLIVACGDDSSMDAGDVSVDATDAMQDAPDARPTCDGVDAFEVGNEGHADPLGSGPTEARAGRLSGGAIPPDPTRLLMWSAGDFVLANDRIAVVIEDVGVSDGFDPWGGKPVGVARVEAGALVEPADFNELVPAVARHTFEPTSVTVLADGDAAVVRAVGPLRPIPFIDELAATFVPGDFDDMEVAVDYLLRPGSDKVEVTYTVANPRAAPRATSSLFLVVQEQRMPLFGPDQGFFLPEEGEIPWLGFADDDATSYAIRFLPDPTGAPLVVSGAAVFVRPRRSIPACAITVLPYYELTVAGPGVDGVRRAIWADEGVTTRPIEGVVRNANGSPAQGVRVHAESNDGELWYSRTRTDATGAYSLTVPDDAVVRLRAYRRGEGVVGPIEEMTTTDFDLPPMGSIAITATDAIGGVGLPVRVQVRPVGDGAVAPPERFGEVAPPRRRTHLTFPTDGRVELVVPPGDHQVVVSRGYEYTAFDSDVTVAADARTDVNVQLERVVDTSGVLCADFHLHTNRSPDAPDSAQRKLRSAAGEGLEIPCRSDHEWVTQWEDVVGELGLESWLFGITSLELTTLNLGHFGVLPLDERPELSNRGSVDWFDRLPPDFFGDIRGLATDPLLIINHPRLSGLGYFDSAGYDPLTGEVEKPELWDDGFSIIEVFNDPPTFDTATESVADWFSFLNQGRRMWAVGSSDSHGISARDMVIGYPRTCLQMGTDDVATLRSMGPSPVRDVTRSGQFTVVGGVFVDAWARGDVRPGGEVTGVSGAETVRVRVQAAPWVDVDELEVWVDGVLSETIAIPESIEVVRFDEMVATDGAWVVFHAKGDRTLDPVHQDRQPFGVTSPIFFTP